MYILGINSGFGGGYQDPCACLYKDGHIIAAVEEERLNKIKFSTGIFPLKSIQEVLQLGNISIREVAVVAFHGSTWQGNIDSDIRSFLLHHFGHCPDIRRYHHHDAHAASTYFLSGFEEALICTMDNSGDGISSRIMTGSKGQLNTLRSWERPNSLGTFYSCITQLAGFQRDADEYKLMGLAPYGNPEKIDLSDFLYYSGDGNYTLNTAYLYPIPPGQSFPNKQIPLYSKALTDKLKIPEVAAIPHTDFQKDLAAAAQYQLEKVVTEWLRYWILQTGIRKVCLAGGVAMNCVLSQQIAAMPEVEALYIPPFAGDQGISIGNALLAGASEHIAFHPAAFRAYTGRAYSAGEIETVLQHHRITYSRPTSVTALAASYIASGKIIGWFQGAAEIGARALGNRSILANPAIPGMKDKINQAIKFRESFRPFCPSVLAEDAAKYFELNGDIPYMNRTVHCRALTREALPEIVHVDGTARVQTVSSGNNAIFHELIIAVKQHTGHGVVINTSLNVRQQPMAYDINDALTAFFTSGMDALFIGDFLIEK